MNDAYSLSALCREVDCDLRGLEIPAEFRQPVRTASLRDWEPREPDEWISDYDARITTTTQDEEPGLFRRFVVGVVILAAALLAVALLFPEAF